jgi:hypothetical protein
MALNFGLLGDAGAPAMGYLQGQQDVARNQLAQQQIETGRMTQDKMRMEMDAMKRRQAGLDQFMQKAKELGVDGDPEQLTRTFYEHAISTGDMQQVQAAQMAVQAAKERKEYMASQPGAGGAVATPVPMTNNLGTALPPAGAPPMPFSAGAAPAAAPPQGNALGGNRLSQIENRLLELRRFPTAGKQERDDLIKERDRLMTPYVVGDSLVTLGGGAAFTAPAKAGGESPLAKLQREMAALPPGDPARAQYEAAINKETTRAAPPVVNISNVTEKAEAADYGKLLVKDYDAVKASSDLARKSLPAIDSNLAILNKGFSTGFGTDTVAAGAKVLGALGVKDAEKFASNSQVFLANANSAVLQKQLEQKGVQTAADADRITSTGAQLGNTKAANEFILKVAKEQLQRDIEQRDFYAAWRDTNQTFNGAENAWFTGPGSKSLFDRPALKAYAAGPNVKEVAPDRTKGLDKIFGKPR